MEKIGGDLYIYSRHNSSFIRALCPDYLTNSHFEVYGDYHFSDPLGKYSLIRYLFYPTWCSFSFGSIHSTCDEIRYFHNIGILEAIHFVLDLDYVEYIDQDYHKQVCIKSILWLELHHQLEHFGTIRTRISLNHLHANRSSSNIILPDFDTSRIYAAWESLMEFLESRQYEVKIRTRDDISAESFYKAFTHGMDHEYSFKWFDSILDLKKHTLEYMGKELVCTGT